MLWRRHMSHDVGHHDSSAGHEMTPPFKIHHVLWNSTWRIPTYMYIYMIQSVCNTTSSTDEGCGRIHPYNICSCAHVHHCNTLRNCHVHVPVYDWSMTSRTCVWAGYNGRDIAITDDKSEVKLVRSLVDLRLWVHDLSMNFDLQLLTFCVDDL